MTRKTKWWHDPVIPRSRTPRFYAPSNFSMTWMFLACFREKKQSCCIRIDIIFNFAISISITAARRSFQLILRIKIAVRSWDDMKENVLLPAITFFCFLVFCWLHINFDSNFLCSFTINVFLMLMWFLFKIIHFFSI